MMDYCQQMMNGMLGSGLSGGGMMNGMMGMGGPMMLAMLLFWTMLIVALVLLVHWLWTGRAAFAMNATARDILDQRYARGELDPEEYQRRRAELSRGAR
jgi:putative membrane protein